MAKKKIDLKNPMVILVLVILGIFVFRQGGVFTGAHAAFASVTRSVDRPTVYNGDTVTVTLDVLTAVGDKALLIEDTSPFTIIGLTTNVYQTGIIDQIQVSDTTKGYSFVANTLGTKTFTGKFTVNGGADQSIVGLSSIEVVSCTPTTETCNNIDDNCDYSIDESIAPQSCYSGPSGTENIGICVGGSQTCSIGIWGTCTGEQIPLTEICNSGSDEDCDGSVLVSNTIADLDCNQAVDWTEINTAITGWLGGSVDWTSINQIIVAWLG